MACSATIRSVRFSPEPPIHSGIGDCSGFGSARASVSVKCLPANDARGSVQSLRMTWQASSSMSIRTPMRGNGMPYSPCSSSFQAAPTPNSIRPPETWSIVAAILATTAGWR